MLKKHPKMVRHAYRGIYMFKRTSVFRTSRLYGLGRAMTKRDGPYIVMYRLKTYVMSIGLHI